MTTSMAVLRLSKNIPLRSLIQCHLNPITIATANSIEAASESKSKLRPYETRSRNLLLQNDVAVAVRNQVGLASGEMAPLWARGRAVKIDDEFDEEDSEDDDSDEFEEEEFEFDEMDGEDCDDEDDEDEDPVYTKRK